MAGILLHGRERPAEEMIALAERFLDFAGQDLGMPGVRKVLEWLDIRVTGSAIPLAETTF